MASVPELVEMYDSVDEIMQALLGYPVNQKYAEECPEWLPGKREEIQMLLDQKHNKLGS